MLLAQRCCCTHVHSSVFHLYNGSVWALKEPAAVRQAALRAGQAGGAAGARAIEGARVPAEARLAEERFVLRDFIVAERWRGIGWLLAVTVFVCWVSGVMDRDNALMP